MKLTKETIDQIPLTEPTTPPEPANVKIYWDDELKGYGLKVTSKKKIFIAQANIKGKTRRVTIGQYGKLAPEQARKEAKKAVGKIAEGIDPSEERIKEKTFDLTLSKAVKAYIESRPLKPLTISDINKHLKTSFEEWQDLPVSKITREKARRIPTDKIGIAWNFIQSLRGSLAQTDISRTLADYMAFLMLTGCRKSEAVNLTWDRVNLSEKWWYLPDPKNKHSVTLPLSEAACRILEERPQTSEYVFSGTGKKGHIDDAKRQFKKLSVLIDAEVSAHDMRRTFKAIAGDCKIELWRCKLLLNHQDSDVTINSYTETSDLRYLAPEINQISEYIEEQGKIAAADNVVPFPARKKA